MPRGSVPNTRPRASPRRPAQNASATAGGAVRTSSEAWKATARSSTARRASHCASSPASSAQRRRQRVEVGVEPRVAAAGELALGEEGGQALGLARQRAQDVEAHDVAGALPDAVQRRVAQQLRHRALLDVAVAAQALERLHGVRRRALADPVLEHRGGEAAELVVLLVVRAREPQRGRGRGLGLDREVGEHVEHQRLLGQRRAERGAPARVVDRLGDAAAHPGGASRSRSPAACG